MKWTSGSASLGAHGGGVLHGYTGPPELHIHQSFVHVAKHERIAVASQHKTAF